MKKTVCLFLAVAAILFCRGAYAQSGYDNYIEEFAGRYAAFAKKKKDKSYRDVLIAVNLGLDRPNYKDAILIKKPEDTAVFVSKHYRLPLSYKPEDLVAVDKKYAQSGVRLRADCCRAFLSMANDMEKEGMQLYIKAGYRVNRKRTGGDSLWYAFPGHSEHQTGLAFDLRKKNVTYKTLGAYDYEKTREYAWLCKNAYRYGFILSYPEGKSELTGFGFEPWHWRYVGAETAADMKSKGFSTYQEYWATYLVQDAVQANSTWYVRPVRCKFTAAGGVYRQDLP
ncbi:MAG TPA: M15 family metallopeptidase [Feifaniaceae bacterium]|nr:M15 family metallopeptidase [Feifaniaceae bacterium]